MTLSAKNLGLLGDECDLALRWEALVKACPESGIMQSLAWAQMKRNQGGLTSLHVGLFFENELVGGCIFYISQEAKNLGTGIMVAPEGPVVPWQDRQKCALYLRTITAFAQDYADQNGIMSMRIEPRLPVPSPAVLREFGRAPADLVPRDTLYVDLDRSEEEILASMKSKCRYNIRLADRHGVSVSAYADFEKEAVADFFEALSQASVRDKFSLEPREFFDNMLVNLCSKGHATLFLAHHETDLLGVLLLVNYGQRATYLYGGITDSKRNLMGGYALQWAAMKRAGAMGCKTYDFYGYVPHRSPEHRYSRFSQFKSQFGGQYFRFIGAHDYLFLDNIANVFIKAARQIEGRKKEKVEISC